MDWRWTDESTGMLMSLLRIVLYIPTRLIDRDTGAVLGAPVSVQRLPLDSGVVSSGPIAVAI